MNIVDLPFNLKQHPVTIRMAWQSAFARCPDIAYQYYQDWENNNFKHGVIPFMPARVLAQDFTGVPLVVDLASLRCEASNPSQINPVIPVHMIIDHSVTVDFYGSSDAFKRNFDVEFERNYERYKFLKWASRSFDNLKIVPPGKGICHQINIEHLASIACEHNNKYISDSCVGTDSHTTMAGALGILAWGVGGIEAEAALLGTPLFMPVPKVIGFHIYGKAKPGVTATDIVLNITQVIRQHNAVGKFVEFYGDGASNLLLEHRATISNMAPEYGATCGFFHTDDKTYKYLHNTGRSDEHIDCIKSYIQHSGFDQYCDSAYDQIIEFNLSDVQTSLAGPHRPQDMVYLQDVNQNNFTRNRDLSNGAVVLAAITSCTNTSNPFLMIQAALLAKNALEKGLQISDYTKTSFAPGSKTVKKYLSELGLMSYIETLGFHIVGYGCTTCIGNSGPLSDDVAQFVKENKDVVLASVLSGNRNFPGRVHPDVQLNYLASPALVIAFAIAGTTAIDMTKEPLNCDGLPIYLSDIWPSDNSVVRMINSLKMSKIFNEEYADIYKGNEEWENIPADKSDLYHWNAKSTYIRQFPVNEMSEPLINDTCNLRALLLLGDSITTDHISPAGKISAGSPAAKYLENEESLNSYGSRRGNHEVMMRGTFANVRIDNALVECIGGYTKHFPSGDEGSVFDIAMRYVHDGVKTVVIAGENYGTGSSRDWAAKGTKMLGVSAVIAKSFERIHRSNLVGMGVLPLTFQRPEDKDLIHGNEEFSIIGKADLGGKMTLVFGSHRIDMDVAIYTQSEMDVFLMGGLFKWFLQRV